MSEFLCYGGHLMSPGDLVCPKCGSGIASMDGKSLREAQAEEEDEEAPEDEE